MSSPPPVPVPSPFSSLDRAAHLRASDGAASEHLQRSAGARFVVFHKGKALVTHPAGRLAAATWGEVQALLGGGQRGSGSTAASAAAAAVAATCNATASSGSGGTSGSGGSGGSGTPPPAPAPAASASAFAPASDMGPVSFLGLCGPSQAPLFCVAAGTVDGLATAAAGTEATGTAATGAALAEEKALTEEKAPAEFRFKDLRLHMGRLTDDEVGERHD
jgi:hypothetical protein